MFECYGCGAKNVPSKYFDYVSAMCARCWNRRQAERLDAKFPPPPDRAQLPAEIGDVPHERIEARAVDDAATVGDVRYEHVDSPTIREALDTLHRKLGRYPPDPDRPARPNKPGVYAYWPKRFGEFTTIELLPDGKFYDVVNDTYHLPEDMTGEIGVRFERDLKGRKFVNGLPDHGDIDLNW